MVLPLRLLSSNLEYVSYWLLPEEARLCQNNPRPRARGAESLTATSPRRQWNRGGKMLSTRRKRQAVSLAKYLFAVVGLFVLSLAFQRDPNRPGPRPHYGVRDIPKLRPDHPPPEREFLPDSPVGGTVEAVLQFPPGPPGPLDRACPEPE